MEPTSPPADDTTTPELTPLEQVHNELFRQSGATPEQIKVIQDWHQRLTQASDQIRQANDVQATRRGILDDLQAREDQARQKELTVKRLAGGLSPGENEELRGIYRRLVARQP